MKLTQQHIKRHPEKLARFTNVHIWSEEWKLWWRPKGCGYTSEKNDAGIFSAKEAWQFCSHCGPEKKITLVEVHKDLNHDNT